ncbi:MAG: IS91 family transposase [Acidobacteria bacterium]|nr:IS91 family transposase [Acidobacteriota bacterium]
MNKPPFEVADIIRAHGNSFVERNRSWLTWFHLRVLFAIEHCRTAALGGHLDRCRRCGHEATSFNSCRSRHCPKCQTNARNRWLADRDKELLPVKYVHVVFTIPHELAWLALQNKKVVYDLLFRASAATLLEIAADPKHLGAEIGFLSVLHTWGQNLQIHPHIHCVIPAGGLSPDHQRWVHPRYAFFLPVKVLGKVFRGKFAEGLKSAFHAGELTFPGRMKMLAERKAFHAFLRPLFRKDWVVYAKPPFGGPEHVLQYLARYTHRVAISNHRIVNFADGKVTFRWKDYAHKNKQRLMTVTADEFLRRFLLHMLPRGFVRIRFCGFLANRRRGELLPVCRQLLQVAAPPQNSTAPDASRSDAPGAWLCPHCGGTMLLIEKLTPQQVLRRSARRESFADTS